MSNPENEPDLDISEDEESENESETSSVADDQPKNPEDIEEFSDVEEEIEDDDEVEEEEDEDDDEDDDIETTMKSTTQKPPIVIKPSMGLDEDDEDDQDDDDEDDDENYLQKFDKNIRQDIISQYHPELLHHNDEEVETLCKIVRDSDGNIVDPLHKTVPFITKYEKARILGERAKQINAGAKIFIKKEKTLIDGYLIALREYEEKMIPFIVRRPLPNGGSEYWKLQDLEMID